MKIVKKEVKFNSDKVLAVMKDGKLYVGVSNICLNLGMSQDMKRRQVKNIQSDIVLRKGCVKFDTGVFDKYNQALAIELDYLPLWLAKIRITPNMIDEKKELAKKLVDYQLHAKDVLAAAFLDKPKQLSLPKPKEHKIIKKYYNGVPVMGTVDLAFLTDRGLIVLYN
ncbi:phage antirepressor N-terminal domain-containing protein [Sebaldella sp. S0638]|uniref:phage antirepressor N-terminal domain-containing protein n=1 Tax=Sebaldella sp. S0638 TaxID=2957809 RepID=UPI00209F048B|nr:phage antirepressor N-terminal domain-containing protein [Sebaldella sp. S0638]MCP1224853.1 phage antirepressor N-terminal domain-containing protein [Sebaldella sp. S0638]